MKKLKFSILHLDSLAQGVSKNSKQILFVPKTLPGETGVAEITHQKGNILFGKSTKFTQKSDLRQKPLCPHFDQCEGCAYLHTSYQNEIDLKYKSAKRSFQKWATPLSFTPAPQRTQYRNRIQLHYHRLQKRMGFYTFKGKSILEVPHCLLPHPLIAQKLQELYEDQRWLELTKKGPQKGHIELYLKDHQQVQVHLNAPYSSGGFTQVNQQMNHLLLEKIKKMVKPQGPLLDCFGGLGNLTRPFKEFPTLVVDLSSQNQNSMDSHQKYLAFDLYQKQAFLKLQKSLTELNKTSFDGLIIDPPRSGWKELARLVEWLRPRWLLYLSCFYPTMIRDLTPLQKSYTVKHAEFFDFFPGTKHLETLVILERFILK